MSRSETRVSRSKIKEALPQIKEAGMVNTTEEETGGNQGALGALAKKVTEWLPLIKTMKRDGHSLRGSDESDQKTMKANQAATELMDWIDWFSRIVRLRDNEKDTARMASHDEAIKQLMTEFKALMEPIKEQLERKDTAVIFPSVKVKSLKRGRSERDEEVFITSDNPIIALLSKYLPLQDTVSKEMADLVEEVATELIKAGVNLSEGDSAGSSLFHYVLMSESHRITASLLEAGADPNQLDKVPHHLTPFHTLVRHYPIDMVYKALETIQKSAAPFAKHKKFGSAFLMINPLYPGATERVEALLEAGYDIHEVDESGQNIALKFIMNYPKSDKEYSLEPLQTLKIKGADFFKVDADLDSALHLAMQSQSEALIAYLLQQGLSCYLDLPNKKGETPLALAQSESPRIHEMFLAVLEQEALLAITASLGTDPKAQSATNSQSDPEKKRRL